ncbi:MAG TPA: LLM class F420-dependent oxidoreductase [Planosporangium sp.]|jgi:probable F420-dependent oxidoreductase|nr:LLM class F420-dependent oxidoreductase [Planosporangium sp.]
MDFGVGYFPTHDSMNPGYLAQILEDHGQDALLFAEHTHIPASRESPWPEGPEGTPLPRKYWHCYDLFVALMAAAAATSKLRIGSGICLVVERDPIVTAKAVASVDHLSGGRFEFGVGAGWNREEMRNHGTDPRKRMAIMRERVEAMKAIWTQEEASYSGEYVNFERIWSYPKPAQRPHPPVLVGGDGPTVLDRVLAFGDAWLPNYRGDDTIFDRIDELRSRADRPIEVQILSAPPDPVVLERMERAGVRRALHWLPSGGAGPVLQALEVWEDAIVQYTGG